MNYIKKLEKENADKSRRLEAMAQINRELTLYLTTHDKFKGACEDYVSIHEVLAYLDRQRNAQMGYE